MLQYLLVHFLLSLLFNPFLAIFALRFNDLVMHRLLCAEKHMTLNHTVNAARIG